MECNNCPFVVFGTLQFPLLHRSFRKTIGINSRAELSGFSTEAVPWKVFYCVLFLQADSLFIRLRSIKPQFGLRSMCL
jgi:hypothetical protein